MILCRDFFTFAGFTNPPYIPVFAEQHDGVTGAHAYYLELTSEQPIDVDLEGDWILFPGIGPVLAVFGSNLTRSYLESAFDTAVDAGWLVTPFYLGNDTFKTPNEGVSVYILSIEEFLAALRGESMSQIAPSDEATAAYSEWWHTVYYGGSR